jgi:hypothetical protein
MSAQPDTPGLDTGSYEVIHLGRPRSWCQWPTSCACGR